MSNLRRKNCEEIALQFAKTQDGTAPAEKEVAALQTFVTGSPWEANEAHRAVQALFAEELVPSCSEWTLGTVRVIDESGHYLFFE